MLDLDKLVALCLRSYGTRIAFYGITQHNPKSATGITFCTIPLMKFTPSCRDLSFISAIDPYSTFLMQGICPISIHHPSVVPVDLQLKTGKIEL